MTTSFVQVATEEGDTSQLMIQVAEKYENGARFRGGSFG